MSCRWNRKKVKNVKTIKIFSELKLYQDEKCFNILRIRGMINNIKSKNPKQKHSTANVWNEVWRGKHSWARKSTKVYFNSVPLSIGSYKIKTINVNEIHDLKLFILKRGHVSNLSLLSTAWYSLGIIEGITWDIILMYFLIRPPWESSMVLMTIGLKYRYDFITLIKCRKQNK